MGSVCSSPIMDLESRGHYSSIKDKKQSFWRKSGQVYTCYKSVIGGTIGGATGGLVLLHEQDNLSND